MPFCTQCGKPVSPADVFCAGCGGVQPKAPAPGPSTDYLSGISARTASLLCYIPILGWLAAIVVLASTRFRTNRRVRFDAFQGLYLFVAWLIVDWVISPMAHFNGAEFGGMALGHPFARAGAGILNLLIIAAWIVMMIKASRSEHYRLPIVGDLAERSVAEQRV